MAFQAGLAILRFDVEAAFHRFAVAGAVGIGAAEHFGNFVGQGQVAFGHHFEIGDGVGPKLPGGDRKEPVRCEGSSKGRVTNPLDTNTTETSPFSRHIRL